MKNIPLIAFMRGYYLGQCYDTGKGVKKDLHKALYWFGKAADAKHPIALYDLGCFYSTGEPGVVEQNIKKAV